MKKLTYLLVAILTLSLGACKKYLDTVPDNVLTIDDIFKSRDNVIRYLGNIYAPLPDELQQRFVGNGNSGPWIGASDEGKYNWDFNYCNNMNKSAWTINDGPVNTYWREYYKAIRNASDFISRIDASTADVSQSQKTRYKGEARALRAFYYYLLLRTYGPVVLIGSNLIPADAPPEALRLPRSSFDQCINFVTTQFDSAYLELPSTSEFQGQMNKGIVKAYKAEALLLAASPLFNGNTDYATLKNDDGTQLISQTVDPSKWTKAATAYKEFLTEFENNPYRLYTVADPSPFNAAYRACRDVVLDNWNVEWIFGRSNSTAGASSLLRYDRTPLHAGATNEYKGAAANGATQKQVDAYFMRNGLPITDPLSTYSTGGFTNFQAPFDNQARSTYNEWVNREPRFYAGITYNNSRWLYPLNFSVNIITNMEFNGNSGRAQNSSDVTPTGYAIRKNVPAADNVRSVVYLRLAQIYLGYAEALNESNPGNPDILKYLNEVRKRAGIPEYGAAVTPAVPIPAGQAAMRDAIRAERRVELAFENVRYFDTRRWKIAEQTDNGPFLGMNLAASGNAFYNKVVLDTRVFRKRDYLFPIPGDEVLRNNALKQNTGW